MITLGHRDSDNINQMMTTYKQPDTKTKYLYQDGYLGLCQSESNRSHEPNDNIFSDHIMHLQQYLDLTKFINFFLDKILCWFQVGAIT